MANQIVLAWTVSVDGTPLSPAQAQGRLAGVKLYDNPLTDPVLGQTMGLTVASDNTAKTATGATRELKLNMTSAVGAPLAPPPFPCNPITATPPKPPYPLRKTVTLPGSFFVQSGSKLVKSSATQIPSLSPGDSVQFLSQLGVFYVVAPASIMPTSFKLTTPYTGTTDPKTGAFREAAAPATIPAIYSTSPLDTAGTPGITPPIPPGSGAQTVSVSWIDSQGAVGNAVVALQGKLPVVVPLGATVDVAIITDMHVVGVGAFGNSVGQLTLCELSAPPPTTVTTTPYTPNNTSRFFFQQLTDQTQNLITRALAYLPPSYFALVQQQASAPQLAGDFIVTTGSTNVPTTADQTAVLAPGSVLQFAAHLENATPFGAEPVFYTVKSVTAPSGPGTLGMVILTTPYAGLGPPANPNLSIPTAPYGTDSRGTKSTQLLNFATGAQLYPPPAAPPSNVLLAGAVAQSVNPGDAVPPPNPPAPEPPINPIGNLGRAQPPPPRPATMSPAPTFLSDLYTQTIQLALAGVHVSPAVVKIV